jgi:hypothetical protein
MTVLSIYVALGILKLLAGRAGLAVRFNPLFAGLPAGAVTV